MDLQVSRVWAARFTVQSRKATKQMRITMMSLLLFGIDSYYYYFPATLFLLDVHWLIVERSAANHATMAGITLGILRSRFSWTKSNDVQYN